MSEFLTIERRHIVVAFVKQIFFYLLFYHSSLCQYVLNDFRILHGSLHLRRPVLRRGRDQDGRGPPPGPGDRLRWCPPG